MKFLIAASNRDKAAMNIYDKLVEKYGFKETGLSFRGHATLKAGDIVLQKIDVDSIYASDLDKDFDVSGIVFATRHSSVSGESTLTVHVSGNPTSSADYGGNPKEVAWAWPQRMKSALVKLTELAPGLKAGYRVSFEATHHGPSELKVPVWFVEIGSSESCWEDSEAGAAVSEAIWASINSPSGGKSAVAFGGGHYAPKHSRVCLKQDIAIGHIIPKYAIDEVDEWMVRQLVQKTYGGAEVAVIDWKGLQGEQRKTLLSMLDKLGVSDVIKV